MKLNEELRNAIIEVVEKSDDKFGLPSNENFEPSMEYVLTAVKHYRDAVNYRRKKNQTNSKLQKAFNNLPEETRKQLLEQMNGAH